MLWRKKSEVCCALYEHLHTGLSTCAGEGMKVPYLPSGVVFDYQYTTFRRSNSLIYVCMEDSRKLCSDLSHTFLQCHAWVLHGPEGCAVFSFQHVFLQFTLGFMIYEFNQEGGCSHLYRAISRFHHVIPDSSLRMRHIAFWCTLIPPLWTTHPCGLRDGRGMHCQFQQLPGTTWQLLFDTKFEDASGFKELIEEQAPLLSFGFGQACGRVCL